MSLYEIVRDNPDFPLHGQPIVTQHGDAMLLNGVYGFQLIATSVTDANDKRLLGWSAEDQESPVGWRWLGSRKVNIYRLGERYGVGIQWMLPARLLDAPVIYTALRTGNEFCATCAKLSFASIYGLIFEEGANARCHKCGVTIKSKHGDPNE